MSIETLDQDASVDGQSLDEWMVNIRICLAYAGRKDAESLSDQEAVVAYREVTAANVEDVIARLSTSQVVECS